MTLPASLVKHPQGAWHSQAAETLLLLATKGLHEREKGKPADPRQGPHPFKNLLLWMLIVAGVILAALGEGVEVIAIVVVNALIVFCQDVNGATAIAALKKIRPEGGLTLVSANQSPHPVTFLQQP